MVRSTCRKYCGPIWLSSIESREDGDIRLAVYRIVPDKLSRQVFGEMAEWFKAAVLKTAVGVSLPWVRIPLSPPEIKQSPCIQGLCFISHCVPSARLPM